MLTLWDFYVAKGFHYSIPVVLAHLLSFRKQLLDSSTPSHVLRNWPPLHAESLIKAAVIIYANLPEAVRALLATHMTDFAVAFELVNEPDSKK